VPASPPCFARFCPEKLRQNYGETVCVLCPCPHERLPVESIAPDPLTIVQLSWGLIETESATSSPEVHLTAVSRVADALRTGNNATICPKDLTLRLPGHAVVDSRDACICDGVAMRHSTRTRARCILMGSLSSLLVRNVILAATYRCDAHLGRRPGCRARLASGAWLGPQIAVNTS
jgi:hypothetical protein